MTSPQKAISFGEYAVAMETGNTTEYCTLVNVEAQDRTLYLSTLKNCKSVYCFSFFFLSVDPLFFPHYPHSSSFSVSYITLFVKTLGAFCFAFNVHFCAFIFYLFFVAPVFVCRTFVALPVFVISCSYFNRYYPGQLQPVACTDLWMPVNC